MKHLSKNEKETLKIARDFAKTLRGGELILLSGNLGAGKTVFVKGLAKALGVKDIVKSPTFNLMKCYNIKSKIKNQKSKIRSRASATKLLDIKTLCHIDAYRLEILDDLLDIGLDDYIDSSSIIIVEWADRVKGLEKLAEKVIKIKMEHVGKKNERRITIE